MICILVSALLIAQALCSTTPMAPTETTTNHHHHHRTRVTHEPVETERHTYKYDPASHLMVAVRNHECYVYAMTDLEAQAVHTQHGINQIEIKMLTMIDDSTVAYPTLTHDQLKQMSNLLAHSCGNHFKTVKLN